MSEQGSEFPPTPPEVGLKPTPATIDALVLTLNGWKRLAIEACDVLERLRDPECELPVEIRYDIESICTLARIRLAIYGDRDEW